MYGVAVELLGVACAVYLQSIVDRPVPALYPPGLGLTGAGLVVHAQVIRGLAVPTIYRLRDALVLLAAALYLAGTGWVLINVKAVADAAPAYA